MCPHPIRKDIPSLLELENPNIASYPIESVIAEKLEAIIVLSLLTSRMKDFYDVYIISRTFTLRFKDLYAAISQTCALRKTTMPTETPIVFTEQVYQDTVKQKQWKAFVGKLRNEHSELEFDQVISRISEFTSVLWNRGSANPHIWNPDTGWQ